MYFTGIQKKISITAAVLLFLMISGCAGNKSYESGLELLKEKKYTEAISEFQKVPAGDKDFRLAQSKISYIQGLLSFNDSLFRAAEVRLEKVEADDEYFHDAQLMLDKITQRNKLTEAPRTDTVIIREKSQAPREEKKRLKRKP